MPRRKEPRLPDAILDQLLAVHRETNPRYHALISRFKALTGCPVIVNTSFNVRGEPIL